METNDNLPTEDLWDEETSSEEEHEHEKEEEPKQENTLNEAEFLPVTPIYVSNYNPSTQSYTEIKESAKIRHTPLSLPTALTTFASLNRKVKVVQQREQSINGNREVAAKLKAYVSHVNTAYGILPPSTRAGEAMAREEAYWVPNVSLDSGKRVGTRARGVRFDHNSTRPRSNSIALQGSLGLGVPVRTDLPVSCISLELQSFKPIEELSIANTLTNDLLRRGIKTLGLSYRSYDYGQISTIVDYILSHVTACSLSGWAIGDVDRIKALLAPEDIDVLITASRASAYPSGYPIVHQCGEAILGSCTYKPPTKAMVNGGEVSVSQNLMFLSTIYYNSNAISSAHAQFLAAKAFTHTDEQVIEMQEAYRKTCADIIGPFPVKEGEGIESISIRPKFSNMTEYGICAEMWDDTLSKGVHEMMLSVNSTDPEVREETRLRYRNQVEEQSRLLADLHYIDTLILTSHEGETFELTDRQDIFDNLSMISGDSELTAAILTEIQKWRAAGALCYTAIDNWTCPTCGTPSEDPEKAKEGLIPFSAVHLFFFMAASRVSR